MTGDAQLLEHYAHDRSEPAFRDLVARHVNLVYGTALRVAGGDAHLAQDITQSVFIDLARKAGGLPRDVILPGWLHRHAWFTAANAVRTERRRRQREQTALEMNVPDDHDEAPWERIAIHLDESLDELPPEDRHAVVLRFLDRQDFRAIGAALGISDDAAQKRVSRALDKLREALGRRGAKISGVALASVLTAKAATAAPAGLALAVSTASFAALTTAGTATGLAATKALVMTKLQLAIIGTVLVAGVSVPLAMQHHSLSRLRAENQDLRAQSDAAGQLALEQADQLTELKMESRRLSNVVDRAGQVTAANQAAAMELLDLRGQVSHLQGLTNSASRAAAASTNPMADLLKSPGMQAIMDQTYDLMIDKEYGALLAQLHLPDNSAVAFKKILKDEMLAAADAGSAMFSGDAAKIREAAAAVESKMAAPEQSIHDLLGDSDFARYREYQKTVSQRMTVSSIKDALGDGPDALTAAQQDQLFQVLVDEQTGAIRKSAPASVGGALDALSQANQHIVDRATNFLSSTQADAVQKFLTQSVNAAHALFPETPGK